MSISQLKASLDMARVQQPLVKNTAGSANAAKVQYQRTAMDAEVSAKQQPLKLLYQAAIVQLNEEMESFLGPGALQAGLEQGADITPQAVARRTVSLATGLFDEFKAQIQGEDPESVLDKFMQTISNGIDKGFSEASHILDGLKVFNGEIAANINQTYAHVQLELANFGAEQRNKLSENG